MTRNIDTNNGMHNKDQVHLGIDSTHNAVSDSEAASIPQKEFSRAKVKSKRTAGELARNFLRENVLILCTLLGIVVGFAVGVGLQEVNPSPDLLQWIGLPGELFLRCLKSTIVPVVVCMVITATSSVDPTINRRIAVVAIGLFFSTAVLAVITAVVLFFLFQPGVNTLAKGSGEKKFDTKLQTQDIFLDLIRNILPDNIVGAAISQATTVYTPEEQKSSNISANGTDTVVMIHKKSLGQSSGVNILGLITICAAVGAAANKILPKESAFLSFFHQGQQITLLIMRWLTWTTPVGVASLVAQSIASVSNLGSVFVSIGRLVIWVIVGLLFHQLVTLPVLYAVALRKNPFPFFISCTKAFFVAFAATATSVALPHMLDACKQGGVSPSVSRFVVPMSVTLHADASALYISSASMFVAQTSGEEHLDAASILTIGALSSILSLAIPGVPSASIVTVVIILTSLNCPLHGIALLFTVEWLLDRLRSGVNASSHVTCAALADAICNGRKPPRAPEVTHTPENSWDMEVHIEDEPWVDGPREDYPGSHELRHMVDLQDSRRHAGHRL